MNAINVIEYVVDCSGLEENGSEEGGVRPVYLRCSQGSVTWLYPRGALRVLLRYGTKGKEFQVNTIILSYLFFLLTFIVFH